MIHEISVIMSELQPMFIAPPFGHLGVLTRLDLEGMEVGHTIHFTQFNTKILEGVIVAIEPKGVESIRPDIQKFTNRYKIHWLPWDHTVLWELNAKYLRERQ